MKAGAESYHPVCLWKNQDFPLFQVMTHVYPSQIHLGEMHAYLSKVIILTRVTHTCSQHQNILPGTWPITVLPQTFNSSPVPRKKTQTNSSPWPQPPF